MSRKSAFRAIAMEGVEMAPKLLHLSSTASTEILSPFSPYVSLLIPTMWHFSW